ncbi:MAG: GNAT family N-acetyltransferase [Rhodobacter sp.]|nr:GNAT family N-acetyltransferase [Rhodobacter sp.]MCY4240277.1 GNAT family N-acetyltransferase [Rhodobacter sp.]
MMAEIRPMRAPDGPAVLAIYGGCIAKGHASFEETAPVWSEWDASHLARCRLVAEEDRTVVGWAALSPVSSRYVYAGVGEVSIYLAGGVRGRGVGGRLLDTLIEASEAAGLWTLQAGIFPENAASIALHRKCGFRQVGIRERLGRMTHGPQAGEWRDVMLLERRSPVVV